MRLLQKSTHGVLFCEVSSPKSSPCVNRSFLIGAEMAKKLERVLLIITVLNEQGQLARYALWRKQYGLRCETSAEEIALMQREWIGFSVAHNRYCGICNAGDVTWSVFESRWHELGITDDVFAMYRRKEDAYEFDRLHSLNFHKKVEAMICSLNDIPSLDTSISV